jgi:hypothetical protein
MTKISQYSTDVNITGNDKWIGSDAQNFLITKNFTPNNLANFFNENNVIDIGTSIRYRYQTLLPGEAREQGTISFETEIGPQVNFSAITTFLIAKNTLKGNTVTQYLDFLVDGKVLLSKASNINIFGYYKITSIEPWIPNTNFFVVTVDFLAGNGFISEDLDYLVSLVDKVQDIPPPEWGSITGDIEDQTDLIDYISSQVTTPTLQSVTDEGNSTTNSIILTNDTVPLNIGYDGFNVLTFTDNSVDASLGFTGLNFTDPGGNYGGFTPSGAEFYYSNKQTNYNALGVIYNDYITNKGLDIQYPTSIVGTDKIQTFQDASGTIALTSDITTSTLQEVTDEGNETTNDIIVNGGLFKTLITPNEVQVAIVDGINFDRINLGFNGLTRQTSIDNAGIPTTQELSFEGILTDEILTIPNKTGTLATLEDIPPAGVTSVGLTMPSAFTVTNSPITSSGDIAVTGAGLVSQYVRGDGTLANFPASTGGGASVSFYLNGSVSQGTISGIAFKEMDRTPILGAGTDFTINANGYIQSFITDANVPNQLEIPAGNWNFETYFSASSGGGSPSFYIELYKWNGTTLSLIASNSATPRLITDGTNIEAYFSALAVPQTTLLATDRLAIRIYVTHSGRTITLHTENSHLCQVITTFTTGLTALNGLTNQVQYFDVGTGATNFNISSSGDTHTFNLLFNIRRNANNSSNNNINYNGYAVTGSAESSAVWTITRLTIAASGSITVATATNVAWTDRESATYI